MNKQMLIHLNQYLAASKPFRIFHFLINLDYCKPKILPLMNQLRLDINKPAISPN